MRLFVAVVPPPDVVEALAAAVGSRDESLRWVPPEQWHLTLVFCGDVEERRVPELSERLGRAAARTSPFPVRLAGVGTFPNQAARARVLWTGLTGDTTSLSRLAERCSAAARRTGIEVEDRPFRPHLTLARARRDVADAREVVSRLSAYDGRPWTVSSIRLVHSMLGARVRHETLAEPVLSGQGPR
jgi:2'-5' RNA ligase